MKTLLVAVCLLSGCVHFDRVTLVASTASLACDWGQTRSFASDGWGIHREHNPMLGPTPSVGYVDRYFLFVALVNTAIWTVLPKGWRSAVPVAVTTAQVVTIRGNLETTSLCGL